MSDIFVDCAARMLRFAELETACAIGKNGFCAEIDKREGDGKTPLGDYPLRRLYYRADRFPAPPCVLETIPLEPDMGWCDASADARYNQFVRHPYAASAEHLWRDDELYDLIITLGHNDAPPVPDMGSAIFLHCCKYMPDEHGDAPARTSAQMNPTQMKPTLGCIAIPRDTLATIAARISPQTRIRIG